MGHFTQMMFSASTLIQRRYMISFVTVIVLRKHFSKVILQTLSQLCNIFTSTRLHHSLHGDIYEWKHQSFPGSSSHMWRYEFSLIYMTVN